MAKKRSRLRQDPDPRRSGHARAACRYRTRPARRGDHGLLQGVQRRRPRASAARSSRSRSRSSRTARSRSSPRRRRPRCCCARPPASRRRANTPGTQEAGTSPTPRSPRSRQTKMPDLNAYDLDAAKLQVAGTARSMGIKVVAEPGSAISAPAPPSHSLDVPDRPRRRQITAREPKQWLKENDTPTH